MIVIFILLYLNDHLLQFAPSLLELADPFIIGVPDTWRAARPATLIRRGLSRLTPGKVLLQQILNVPQLLRLCGA